MSSMSKASLSFAIALFLLRLPNASAQDADPQKAAAAQALFEQAMTEIEAKQLASACKKLEEVTRLVPEGVGGRYMLGECYEQLGKHASAWAQYSFAYQLATRFGQTERAADASAKAEALKPKLATLTIGLPQALRNISALSVLRDGVEVREVQWGTAIYVDAGPHEVTLTAPGHTTWKKHVEVIADGVAVKVDVPEDAIRLEAKPQSSTAAPIMPVVISLPPRDRSWLRPVGITTAFIGLTAFGVSGVIGSLAIAKRNESNANGHCTASTNLCDDIGLAQRKEAVGLGNLSTGLFVSGATLTTIGALMFLAAPRDEPKSAGKQAWTRSRAGIGVGPSGVSIWGAF